MYLIDCLWCKWNNTENVTCYRFDREQEKNKKIGNRIEYGHSLLYKFFSTWTIEIIHLNLYPTQKAKNHASVENMFTIKLEVSVNCTVAINWAQLNSQ